jgi:hypothetical protein
MHPKGTSFRAPVVKFIACLDLEKNSSFLDRHDSSSSFISNHSKVMNAYKAISTGFVKVEKRSLLSFPPRQD